MTHCLCYTGNIMSPEQSNLDNTNSNSVPTTPTPTYGIQPKKRKKGLILAVSLVVVLLAAGTAAGYYYYTHNGANSSSTAPYGWKNYTSKRFGISFITPNKWDVSYVDGNDINTGANGFFGYIINISLPPNGASGMSSGPFAAIRVVDGQLDDLVNQTKKALTSSGDAKIDSKSTKWHGHDAVAITASSGDQTQGYLFVQIDNFVFMLPTTDGDPGSSTGISISKSDYTKFTKSIRIDSSVVAAEAKKLALHSEIKQGKDVDTTASVAPAGWTEVHSQKYGISYYAPSTWGMTEQYDGLSGAVLGLTVSIPKQKSMNIMVSESDIDTFTNQSAYLYGAFGGGVKTATTKMKWNGHDARRVAITVEGKPAGSTLFVRVGKLTYNLPDPESEEYGANHISGFREFAESVRIAE